MPRPMPHHKVQTDNNHTQLDADELLASDTLHPAGGYSATLTVCRDGRPIGWVWVEDFGYLDVVSWLAAHQANDKSKP